MRYHTLLIIIIFISFLSSCEKEVNMELKTSDPRLVIDASIGFLNPCYVKLSLTQGYWDQTSASPVSGATITLSDEYGNIESLLELEDGIYASKTTGEIGQTYTLIVEVEGESYLATDKIPSFIPIDDISVYKIDMGSEIFYFPLISFQDPEEENNYYYCSLAINNKKMQQTGLIDDKYFDGLKQDIILGFDQEENNNEKLKAGDEISVEMQSIGKGAYTFYESISSPGGTPDSNPVSNFSGDVLGMFKTYSPSYISMTITEEDLAL